MGTGPIACRVRHPAICEGLVSLMSCQYQDSGAKDVYEWLSTCMRNWGSFVETIMPTCFVRRYRDVLSWQRASEFGGTAVTKSKLLL